MCVIISCPLHAVAALLTYNLQTAIYQNTFKAYSSRRNTTHMCIVLYPWGMFFMRHSTTGLFFEIFFFATLNDIRILDGRKISN